MTELSDGMRRLIEPWSMDVPIDQQARIPWKHWPTPIHPPLVDMLNTLVFPSSNSQGGGGAPNTRNLIDAKSFDLRDHITTVTAAWLDAWNVTIAGELKLDLRGFWDRLHTLNRTGDISEMEFENLASYPDTWAAKIWDLVEPPKQIPMRTTECPKCESAKVVNREGEASDNLLITVRVGHEITAECRNPDCGAVWIGREGLIELGRSLGIEIDVDAIAEVVAEMG